MTLVTMEGPCRIRVLPDLLVNKIAAGEVVERPASVVKELLENAVDAAATRIAITLEEGGRQLIAVTDNGAGMTPEDLRLAVMPHATSKITSDDDLYSISTMGFRGEALASISSVSHLRMVSRPHQADEGFEVRMAGDRFESAQAAGCPVGTTVEVRDLFFNVPARRKFLRGTSTELGHINEQLARVALACPAIGFELTHQKRTTQNLSPCGTRLERIAKFYGPELASELLKVNRGERGLTIEAYAAAPAQSRATNQWQYTFVNGRFIRDRFVQHAVKEAYRGLIDPNRHGVVFLFLSIDPSLLDVNVHPTKIEVRWADSNLIHSQVLSALRECFQRANLSPSLRTGHTPPPVDEAQQDRIRLEMAELLKSTAPIQPPSPGVPQCIENATAFAGDPFARGMADFTGGFQTEGATGPGAEGATGGSPASENDPLYPAGRPAMTRRFEVGLDAENIWRSLYGRPPSPGGAPASISDLTAPPHPRPRAIQMHNLYLVVETDEGILIIDQHALHERVMYENLSQRFTHGPLESQRLLLPETMRIQPDQGSLLESNADLLRNLGIEVTPFGKDTIAIHAFPALLKDTDVTSFMRDLLDLLTQRPAGASAEEIIHKILDMMACKAAVKAGDSLTEVEIESLVAQRHLIAKAASCPHGRPTMLRLTKTDLNRQFKRT